MVTKENPFEAAARFFETEVKFLTPGGLVVARIGIGFGAVAMNAELVKAMRETDTAEKVRLANNIESSLKDFENKTGEIVVALTQKTGFPQLECENGFENAAVDAFKHAGFSNDFASEKDVMYTRWIVRSGIKSGALVMSNEMNSGLKRDSDMDYIVGWLKNFKLRTDGLVSSIDEGDPFAQALKSRIDEIR